MPAEQEPTGLLTEIAQQFGRIFRHMLPGILVISTARVAYPDWFCGIDISTWQHVVVLGAVSVAVGNAWFAFNRYAVHQLFDYIIYLFKSDGPSRGDNWGAYLTDLGNYVSKSLHIPKTSKRAWEHVEFRASAVLLILTVGELLMVFGLWHADDSIFAGHTCKLTALGIVALLIGLWQMIITRRIDYFVVNHKQ